jgi:penicillin-binding protein 1A
MRQARLGHLHTALAGRALFSTIKADLTAFGRHLAILLGSALASRRGSEATQGDKRIRTGNGDSVTRPRAVIVPLIKGIAVAALLLGIMITGGILWALHDTPIAGEPARSDRPSLVLETADGRPLGRTGPLTDAGARSDFPDVLVNAVLSIEDRRFYGHVGIDPLARSWKVAARSRNSSSSCAWLAANGRWNASCARASLRYGSTSAWTRTQSSPST